MASEAELMTEFTAPRDAVREALALLADEGLVLRRRGQGTFCRDGSVSVQVPADGATLDSKFCDDDKISAVLLDWSWTVAPGAVAAHLTHVEPGDDCLCVDYLMLRNERPICLVTNYVRRQEAETLSPARFEYDFYTLLAASSGELGTQDVVLQPRLADAEVAEMLAVEPGAPVLWMERVIRDGHGDAIDFAIVHTPSSLRVAVSGIMPMRRGNLAHLPTVSR